MGTSVRSIYLAVVTDCEADGLNLPPGKYTGTEKRLVVVSNRGEAEWLAPEYTVSLTQPRLHQIAGEEWRDVRQMELNVTSCVSSGHIRVS